MSLVQGISMARYAKSGCTSLLLLPKDILINILSKLPVKSILTCRHVCKSFYYLEIPCFYPLGDCNLPLSLLLNILSRLPLRKTIQCLSVSKPMSNLISDPFFSHIYVKSSSYVIIGLVRSFNVYLPLSEPSMRFAIFIDPVRRITRTSKWIPIMPSGNCDYYSVRGNCNGLLCSLKLDRGVLNMYITNPILGEYIQLPEPIVDVDFNNDNGNNISRHLVYGLGYCSLTSSYKVLRIITSIHGGVGDDIYYQNESQILTLGSDKYWRKVGGDNVPYGIYSVISLGARDKKNPQSSMVAFSSALHWIVQPVQLPNGKKIECKWGGGLGLVRYICAFDMAEEKVSAFALPAKVASDVIKGELVVLGDNLCLWGFSSYDEIINIWVMFEYGVADSWRKRIVSTSYLPYNLCLDTSTPVMLLPAREGRGDLVIVFSDSRKLVFYDMKTHNILKVATKNSLVSVAHISDEAHIPIAYVPNFVSLKNVVLEDVRHC